MKIDFTGVEGQKDFELLPSGKYVVEVEDYKESSAGPNAKNPGAPIISWQLRVQDPEQYEGRVIWENMAIIPPKGENKGTLWRVKGFLNACGFEVDGEIDFDPDAVLGSTCVARVSVQKGRKNQETGEEYDDRNVVKAFLPVADQ